MTYKTFKKIKILITSFVAATVAIAVVYNNMALSLAGVIIGLLFLTLVKRKTKAVLTDERIHKISNQAAKITYIILTSLTGFLSIIYILDNRRTGNINAEMLGITLSYITLFSLALYSISYKYYSKKYGDDEQN
ncbi:DUF2178 domain-containing protein [Patescibacteria group bacterium]